MTNSHDGALGTQSIAALNPYTDKMERERWDEGFARAFDNPNACRLRNPPAFKRRKSRDGGMHYSFLPTNCVNQSRTLRTITIIVVALLVMNRI